MPRLVVVAAPDGRTYQQHVCIVSELVFGYDVAKNSQKKIYRGKAHQDKTLYSLLCT